MHRNMKRITALSLLIIIFLQLVIGYADTANTWSTYQTSSYRGHSLDMQIGESLRFTALPESKEFDYVMVRINDLKGTELKNEFNARQTLLNGTKAIDMGGLADGKYYIEIMSSPEQYSTYWGYIYGKSLGIYVQGGKAVFLTPMVYESDKNVFSANRVDEYALLHYVEPSEDIQSAHPEIVKLANQITTGIESDYEKARAIHDWVCANIWYDWDAFSGKTDYGDTSALGTLKTKKSVCQGYASLTAALLRAADIPSKLVTGYARGVGSDSEWNEATGKITEGNHAWNEAFINGHWIIIDATWDSDNKYENGVFLAATGQKNYKYFDATLESFSTTHKLIPYEEDIPHWWHQDDKTFYVDNKGIEVKGWKDIDHQRFYFDDKGVMKKGWLTLKGKKYYFDEDGVMVRGTTLIIAGKKYVFNANGVLKPKI